MKFVIAPDAYKGTLSQIEVAKLMKTAILQEYPTSEVILKPMADGGEGTLDALLRATENSERIIVQVTGPLGEKIEASIGLIDREIGIIEVASIAGLPDVPEKLRNPYNTTTYGIGEAIKHALDLGVRQFVIGLGGSATNDGGMGMLTALGAKFTDKNEKALPVTGAGLLDLAKVDLTDLDQRIFDCSINIASDVDNPLTGKNGATYVFGPQKGAREEQMIQLDQAMENYRLLMESSFQSDHSLGEKPGAGAAGGLGFAFLLLGAHIQSGAKLVAETIKLEKALHGASFIFTGEGKSDDQTLAGKAPGYVAEVARQKRVKSVLVSGLVDDETEKLATHFDYIFPLVDGKVSLQRAMEEANMVLLEKMEQILRRQLQMVKKIHTDNAPPALGPYSQAIQAGDFLYISGQIGLNKAGEVQEGIEKQTKQVLENLKAVLEAAGADFNNIVKFTIFLDSMEDFATVNDIYASYLSEPYPARSTVEVSRLPKDLLVEMEAIAYLGE